MFGPSPDYRPSAYDDDWEDQPGQGGFYKWFLGMVVPAGLLIYGITRIFFRIAEYGGNEAIMLHGSNAVAFGIAAIGAAVFIHCHYFLGNIYDQIWFAVLGKIVSAALFIGAAFFLIVRIGVYGRP